MADEQNIPNKFTGDQAVDDIILQLVHLVREASTTHPAEAVYHAMVYLAAKMTHDTEHSLHGHPLARSFALGAFMRAYGAYLDHCNAICDAEVAPRCAVRGAVKRTTPDADQQQG